MKKNLISLLLMGFVHFAFPQTTTSVGSDAGNAGTHNTSVGYRAGRVVVVGASYNSFYGSNSGAHLNSGTFNTFLGFASGFYSTSGTYNLFLGVFSGYNNLSGERNLFLGASAGYNSTGSRNVFLGYQAGYNEAGSDKLYIDNSNTSNPLVYGDFSADIVTINGKLGVGTINPERLLEIYSETSIAPIRMTSNRPGGADTYLEFKNKISSQPNSALGLGLWGSMDGLFVVKIGNGDSPPEEKFRVNADGNVGIGTMFPGKYKLAVNGDIKAKEINVSLEGWSDFVFEENYELPPLSQIEEHIKENKHLPGIPSAREVEQNGVDLGKMDALLLQKIEELTLYMIEQEKELKALKEKNNRLEEEVNKLMSAR